MTDAVKNAYHLRSDKAYSLIALSVDKSLQVHISKTTDPHVAWETLQKQFEFVSITQIVRLNCKFYAATMKEGTDIMEHLTYMTSLAEQLRELKEEISDQKFATVILGSLPESYDNFISSLNARKVDELNWDNVKGMLVEEYTKRKEKQEQQSNKNESRNEALFSRRGNLSGRGRGRYQRGGRYMNKSRLNYNRQSPTQEVKCFKCQQVGHIVKNCPLNKKPGQSNIAEEKQTNEDSDVALNSTLANQKQSNYWFIDSGATKHMTFRRDLITDYVQYKTPSKIYLGDNTVIKAYGEGKVRLECYDESSNTTVTLQKAWVQKSCLRMGNAWFTKDNRTLDFGHIVDNKLYITHKTLLKFKEFVNMVENASGHKVQTLRTDNGGEYASHDFTKFCTEKGIFHQFTNRYTPEQNGISERLNSNTH